MRLEPLETIEYITTRDLIKQFSKEKKKVRLRGLLLFNYFLVGIKTKNNSTTIGTWRRSTRNNDFKPRIVSVSIPESCINYCCRFIDIRYGVKNACVISKFITDKYIASNSTNICRSNITSLKIDTSKFIPF